MGFSASSTQLIFFIGSVLIATMLVGVFFSSIYSISDSIRDKENELSSQLTTDVEIINDPDNIPNDPLIIYVKNTGSRTLDQNRTTVIINGTVQTTATITTIGSEEYWKPGEVIAIEMDMILDTGDHRVKVVMDNGVDDVLSFEV